MASHLQQCRKWFDTSSGPRWDDTLEVNQLLVDQFHFIRSNAVEPLSTFLDYIT